mmetsp:Transcript_24006/g.53817  ORF Transcript_24006/g.53817 Transcript_24006/m.53817 type:complete len:100 (-) Transcript_24006:491-790(-)
MSEETGKEEEEAKRQQEMEKMMRDGMNDALKRLTKRGRMELVSFRRKSVSLVVSFTTRNFVEYAKCLTCSRLPSTELHRDFARHVSWMHQKEVFRDWTR